MMFLPSSAVMPSGSLTEGVPAASYGPGHYAFRTSILYLGMEPVPTSEESFRVAMNARLQPATGGDYAASMAISVGAPFQQSVPATDRQSLIWGLTLLVEGALLQSGLVSLGMAIDAATQTVKAQWLTIEAALHAPRAFTLDALNIAIAGAVGDAIRLRHWERRDIIVPAPADSVLARTRAPNACAGARLFSNVTAAACTRVQYTGAWTAPAAPQQPVVPRPAARPPAPQQPQPARPAPRPAARPPAPSPVAPPQQYRPPAEAVSPWWYAVGAVAIAGAVVLITTKDSR